MYYILEAFNLESYLFFPCHVSYFVHGAVFHNSLEKE